MNHMTYILYIYISYIIHIKFISNIIISSPRCACWVTDIVGRHPCIGHELQHPQCGWPHLGLHGPQGLVVAVEVLPAGADDGAEGHDVGLDTWGSLGLG